MRTISRLPPPVKSGLKKLGQDIRKARLRREITMEIMSKNAAISRVTLTKVEKGDPSVALGIYAKVLFVLGFTECLTDLVDNDKLGLAKTDEKLPKRVRPKFLTQM